MSNQKPIPGTNGNHYVPYNERSGKESIVYFTRDLSAKGLLKVYNRIQEHLNGKVAVKLHTGEQLLRQNIRERKFREMFCLFYFFYCIIPCRGI